jgi:hypothetical protein
VLSLNLLAEQLQQEQTKCLQQLAILQKSSQQLDKNVKQDHYMIERSLKRLELTLPRAPQ